MNTNVANDYFHQKKALLEQCLHLSEELCSSVADWDSVPDVMARKEAAIMQLKDLEEAAGSGVKASLSQEMTKELDRMIKLILDLDQEAASRIRKEQQDIKESLKSNIQGQKLIQYVQVPEISSGRKLDYKK